MFLFAGQTNDNQAVMKQVELDKVPEHVCETQLRATKLGQVKKRTLINKRHNEISLNATQFSLT